MIDDDDLIDYLRSTLIWNHPVA